MSIPQRKFALAAALASAGALGVALLAGDAGAPQVSVAEVNPGTRVERDLCLSVSVGPGAASECGDLRLAHALPALRTLNRARAPVLVYNSQHASPRPIVAARVALPGGTSGLSRVVALLKINGTPRAQGVWSGARWPAGTAPVRIAVAYDAASDPTGPYRYTLEVRAHYGATVHATTARGELVVVNRRESSFGAGWWLAGLEQLVLDPFNKPVLWVGGDGSTRRYTAARGDSVWGAPSLDRPDSLKRAGGGWVRILPGGARVEFDGAGRHTATVNRLEHRTAFHYNRLGQVEKVTVPLADAARFFGFTYSGGRLARVEAPGTGSSLRVTQIHNGGARVDSITDADGTRVRFGYAPAEPARIVSRTDRRRYRTDFSYDAGFRLSGSTLWMEAAGAGKQIASRLRAAESLGLAVDGAGALPSDSAYALIDGPRPDGDALDRTKLWVNRWGAPVQIVDAAGRQTLLTRADPRFPALVTRMDGPVHEGGGRQTITAVYDTRGNLEAQTDSSERRTRPDGSIAYATTRYERTHPVWRDFVTRAVMPEGEVIRMDYDSLGNRIWQQPGDDESRRVGFGYNQLGLPSRVTPPAVEGHLFNETYEYDALGNLSASLDGLYHRTVFHNDALGRAWKVETPISEEGDTIQVQENTFYPNSDQVEYSRTTGPAMNNAPRQTAVVRNRYDEEGNLRFVERWSEPRVHLRDSIGPITTEFRYDAAGRKVAEVAPDSRVDSTSYDDAGNAFQLHTRRVDPANPATRLVITMEYDELNRLKTRNVPAVTYPARRVGLAQHRSPADIYYNPVYPQYPNSGTGYRIDAQTSRFTYDVSGGIKSASNGDAEVTRTYRLNGRLETEVQRIRTVASQDLSKHEYRIEYTYDLSGRRTGVRHPRQLGPRGLGNDWTRYGYDADGALETLTDALDNVLGFRYDARGDLRELHRPAMIREYFQYRADRRVAVNSVRDEAAARYLRLTDLEYDARGKLLNTLNHVGSGDTLRARYSGLGHLVWAKTVSRGVNASGNIVVHTAEEQSTLDALGNVFTNQTAMGTTFKGYDANSFRGQSFRYHPGSGRLRVVVGNPHEDTLTYDGAGNTEFRTTNRSAGQDRYSYYAADGTLRAADQRLSGSSPSPASNDGYFKTNFEEYWYDPLGRRVLVRARRHCVYVAHLPSECTLDKVRRTVWDGDEELYEIQMPDNADAESDGVANKLNAEANGSVNFDPNAFFGRVAYTTGGIIDQPLSVIRMGFADAVDSIGYMADFRRVDPVAIFPLWNLRGQPERGVFNDGRPMHCAPHAPGERARCMRVTWMEHFFVLERPKVIRTAWHGTLLEDKQDEAGTFYRRNRYLDPTSGRFTQEDPIGLAGGLNLYGFANGDPVSYSDPYGLSAQANCEPFCTAIDVAFLAADINDARKNGLGWRNGIGIGLGVVAVALPLVTGLGALDDVAKVADGGADFIVTSRGTAIPTSQSRMRAGFDNAGFPSRPTQSPGVEHTLPNGNRVRTMEPAGNAPRRASFENRNGQPVTPDGAVPHPPRGATRAERTEFVRARTHVEQTP